MPLYLCVVAFPSLMRRSAEWKESIRGNL